MYTALCHLWLNKARKKNWKKKKRIHYIGNLDFCIPWKQNQEIQQHSTLIAVCDKWLMLSGGMSPLESSQSASFSYCIISQFSIDTSLRILKYLFSSSSIYRLLLSCILVLRLLDIFSCKIAGEEVILMSPSNQGVPLDIKSWHRLASAFPPWKCWLN